MPRCLPRPKTSIFVTAGKPASNRAFIISWTFSGRTTDWIMVGIIRWADTPVGSVVESEFHQQFFQLWHREWLRDDKSLILIDRPSQGAVLVGLTALRVPLDDRLAVDLGALHV